MRITKHDGYGSGGVYFTVDMDPREFISDSGKIIPYGFAVGTIRETSGGKVEAQLWRPAASHPRDYKKAALRYLEEAAHKQFGRCDKVKG